MTMARAQMDSFCGTNNGAGFAARAFALILVLVDIVLAVSILIYLDSIIAAVLLLVVLFARVFVHCRKAVG